MNIVIDYFNNNLEVSDENVFSIEIENKSYFYRFISNLFEIYDGENVQEIKMFVKDKEVSLTNKINVIVDYFNFSELFKSYNTFLIKFLNNKIDSDEKERSLFRFNRVCSFVNDKINEIDIPFYVKTDFTFDVMLKSLKLDIICKDSLLENLFLLIDIEKELRVHEILFFVNLKQYLKREELVELYKYAIYNGVNIILVDSQAYGIALDCEKKLVIDEQLDEFMI